MRKLSLYCAAILLLAVMNSQLLAVDFIKVSNRASVEKMERELLTAISSADEDQNDKIMSVFELGEMQSSKAVLPLLKMLKSEKNEELRIIAAVSLYKIGDRRGLYAIQQAIKFDESARVRRLCGIFYNEYLRETGQLQYSGQKSVAVK